MDQNQAKFLAQFMSDLWESEFPVTCKVLSAVPEDRRDYRPDEKSRSAWELATHIATADVWFMNSILGGSFVFDEEAAKKQTAGMSTIPDVVAFYKKEFPARLNEIR